MSNARKLEIYQKRSRELPLEVAIDSLILNGEGLLNDVVIVKIPSDT